MVDQKLVDYIKKSLKQGVSMNTTKSQLKKNGWSDNDIKDAFQFAIPETFSKTEKTLKEILPDLEEEKSNFCWKCGTANDATAKVCKNCTVNLEKIPEQKEKEEITRNTVILSIKPILSWVEPILSWFFGLFFIFIGFYGFLSKVSGGFWARGVPLLKFFISLLEAYESIGGGHRYILAILEIWIGILILPITNNYLQKRFNIKIDRSLKILIVVIYIISMIILFVRYLLMKLNYMQ